MKVAVYSISKNEEQFVERWAAYQATSAAGTISKITTSLPTAATNNIAFGSGFRIGRNSSATNTGAFTRTDVVPTGSVGVDPNVAMAVNDELLATIITEINQG